MNTQDILLLDDLLSEEELSIQQTAKDFCQNQLMPRIVEANRNEIFDRDIYHEMGELGFLGAPISGYGCAGVNYVSYGLIAREIERVDSSYRSAYSVQTSLAMHAIHKFGSEDQKEYYLPKMASGSLIGCFGLTEPDAGSDPASMKTKAKETDRGYVLNGSKTWISNAHQADVLICYAYSDKSAGSRGLSAFVIEPKNFDGITTSDLEKMGSHMSPTGEVFLNNVKVPKENILGEPGDGVKIVFSSLNQTRLSAAAGAVGTAQACLDLATKYCNEREQFGQPIGKYQMNQDMIAQMTTDIEAARLLVYKAAWQKDQGQLNNGLEVAQAKLFAGETAMKCSNFAIRIMGAYGYSTEYPIERFYRDIPTYVIVEGSSNVCKTIIAQDKLGYRKANR